jgi:hypothetical protein
MTQSEPLNRMRQQFPGGREKLHGVRQRDMEFEGFFVNPLRVDRKYHRFPQRFKYVDAQATGFGTGRFIDPKQLVAKCCFFAGQRLKSHDEVKRQVLPPAHKYVTRIQASTLGLRLGARNTTDLPVWLGERELKPSRLRSPACGRQTSRGSIGAIVGPRIEGNHRARGGLMNGVDDGFEEGKSPGRQAHAGSDYHTLVGLRS